MPHRRRRAIGRGGGGGTDRHDSYWDGATWIYHADVTNGANAGSHTYELVPGAGGNELEILFGAIFNDDVSTRTLQLFYEDDADNILYSVGSAITAGNPLAIPTQTSTSDAKLGSARWILSGTSRLRAVANSIAANQDSAFGITCRIRGASPTVTITSPAAATETVNTEKVF